MKQEINCKIYKNCGRDCTHCETAEAKAKCKGVEWIPCSEWLPENEKEVEITYVREHYLTGERFYLKQILVLFQKAGMRMCLLRKNLG